MGCTGAILITDERYPPHQAPTVFDPHCPQPVERMLSAEEKIAELTVLLEAKSQESAQLQQDLDEMHTEKVAPREARWEAST